MLAILSVLKCSGGVLPSTVVVAVNSLEELDVIKKIADEKASQIKARGEIDEYRLLTELSVALAVEGVQLTNLKYVTVSGWS